LRKRQNSALISKFPVAWSKPNCPVVEYNIKQGAPGYEK
jgi:hypothetical protein